MKSLFIAGLVFFFGSILLIKYNYEKLCVDEYGHIVKMTIESLPKSCIGARVPYFVTYSYKGEMYDKQTRGDFCERHHVGELMDMKMLEGSKEILNPDESGLKSLIALGILGLFGLILSITQWKKIQNENRLTLLIAA